MPDAPVLHVCGLADGGPWFHPWPTVAEAWPEGDTEHTGNAPRGR
jgi:hypothetical protein